MKYLYDTTFKLSAEVNDFDEACKYLTEDDITVYLKEDDRIPANVRDAVIHIEWELIDNDCGKIHLTTSRKMAEDELAYISEYVRGQNSDGLGEGFEQQEFADVYNEDAFNDDLADWEEYYKEAYDKWDELSEEEQDNYGGRDDYANEYANQQWGYEPYEQDDCYHMMCSFDWRTNEYEFYFVEEMEE